MKTVIVNPDETVGIVDAGKPVYGPKQALTRTIANGICGTDITLIHKSFKGIGPETYPIMLGHENVGEVVEVGSEVRGLKVGDKVILPFVDEDRENVGPYGSGWGALSEYGVVNDWTAFPEGEAPEVAYGQRIIPEDIDPVDAVMIVTLREVLSAVRYFGIEKDKPVVVFGAGPVGLTFIKMCKMEGASPVISVVRNEARAENASAVGADIILNSSEIDVDKKIRELYPKGVPYVIDAVGTEAILNEAMKLVADRGHICAYGVPKKEDMHLDFHPADYNWVLNFQQMPRKDEEGAVHDEVIGWIREGKIDLKDFISDYYFIDDAVEAYQDAQNKKILKKGIIVFDRSRYEKKSKDN